MLVSNFPRSSFAHLPTPLERLDRLTDNLGGPEIWIKRDDATGLATGGNKARKLEFLVGDALSRGSDILLTQGAIQSNHCRQTAAIASKRGLDCELHVQHRVGSPEHNYLNSGNALLNDLFGARTFEYSADAHMNARLEERASELRKMGRVPYVIPGGGSNAIGALGYVSCAQEIYDEIRALNLQVSRIVLATGSAGTQAGLIAGLRAIGSNISVTGICVNYPAPEMSALVLKQAQAVSRLIDSGVSICDEDIICNGAYLGEGYGVPSVEGIQAISILAKLEGILLDPVYTSKAMSGMIDLIKRNYISKDETILFLHTGGTPGLFAYTEDLAK